MSRTHNAIEDNDHPWVNDTLSVEDNGRVSGMAVTKPFRDGHRVQISIKSITVESVPNPETDEDDPRPSYYVPVVTVIDESGNIIVEPGARDADTAERALELARSVARDVLEFPDLYLT